MAQQVNSHELMEQVQMSMQTCQEEESPRSEDQPNLNQDLTYQLSESNIASKYKNDRYERNYNRSQFWFAFKVGSSGRHIFSLQKSIIHWTGLKILGILVICYYLLGWIEGINNISENLKQVYIISIYGVIALFLSIIFLDPGYVLDNQVKCSVQELQNLHKLNKIRHCGDCEIFVQKKTAHCYVCGHCVARFDHHCGVMASCVGATNIAPFFFFVFFLNLVYCGIILLAFYEMFFV